MSEMPEQKPMYPSAKSALRPENREKIREWIARRGLCGLANDTKWDEFLAEMRPLAEGRRPWRHCYRFKTVFGFRSEWDCEWFYHLPFPFLGVEWFDVAFLQETHEHRLPPRVHMTDHSPFLEDLLKRVGLDYRKGETMVRIFGYSPRDMEFFDCEKTSPHATS